jgi:hypothetical protein
LYAAFAYRFNETLRKRAGPRFADARKAGPNFSLPCLDIPPGDSRMPAIIDRITLET